MLKKNITLKAVKYVTASLFAMICCTALTVCAFAVKTTCTVYNGSNTYSLICATAQTDICVCRI